MANINLSWIVKLVLLMVGIGVVLGVSVYRNIDTSPPTAVVTPPAEVSQPGPVVQPSITVPQIDPATVDRVLYPFQEMLKITQQFANLAERQNQIKAQQVETTGRQEALAQQLRIAQQKAEQDMALQRSFVQVTMGAGVVLVMVLAASMIIFALLAGWGRLKIARARATQIVEQTQSTGTKDSYQKEEWKKIWRAVGDLSRQQTQLNNEFDTLRQAATATTPVVPTQRNYTDLPLAVMKDE